MAIAKMPRYRTQSTVAAKITTQNAKGWISSEACFGTASKERSTVAGHWAKMYCRKSMVSSALQTSGVTVTGRIVLNRSTNRVLSIFKTKLFK